MKIASPGDHIVQFDRILDLYMRAVPGWGGTAWRGSCHRSAKVAAAALNVLFPSVEVRVRRVELIALMAGATSFAHLGWKGDTRVLDGMFPMHWAVEVDGGLYDPTFWQLNQAKTPLDLPERPFCYAPGLVRNMEDRRGVDGEGFAWIGNDAAPGLRIGYCLRDDPLPAAITAALISDDEALFHGREAAFLARRILP